MRPGKLSTHILHAISVMSLNHKFQPQEYRSLFGLDSGLKLLDLIDEMIRNYQKKVEKDRFPTPVLTDQDEFNFQNSTHCAYCHIEYSKIPKYS